MDWIDNEEFERDMRLDASKDVVVNQEYEGSSYDDRLDYFPVESNSDGDIPEHGNLVTSPSFSEIYTEEEKDGLHNTMLGFYPTTAPQSTTERMTLGTLLKKKLEDMATERAANVVAGLEKPDSDIFGDENDLG
jgi:hypothetical protein